ncbi:hypothetical protein [Amycolatopsis regifaucium]|uniref:Ricin B lectin domain-containing protein n=1 Tax=Amycolatopsis regifaucium TaxID=546365 RepID=A0A154M6W3_9PSEU|nr:hypothetical protein [Amycolatopsis regifaucium]KZB80322.1 hypothetical protein AVL48_12490 [Amycolatopsis regifaucium]OKA05290.1 hypothetical protein ATP06_0226305 [Amycolatopsis regifaucium]SFJ04053.1 hypothetical protein SAMN04489731_11531 [Amycolatopsis regifaucium]
MFAACLAGSAVLTAPARATSSESAARSQDKPVEMLSERTGTSSTFANPDGSRTTQVHGGPVHVRRDGDWVPVDLRYAVQNAGKLLDQGCTATQGAPLFIWDRIPGRGCQNWRMPVSPANGVTVQWLPFTVNTAAG